jgi:outer membrane protein TolC
MGAIYRIGTSLLIVPLLAGCMATTKLDPATVRSDLQGWNAEVYEQGEQLNSVTEQRTAQIEADQLAARTGDGADVKSLTLAELYEAGITNNYRLLAARKSMDIADAELVNATLRFFPSINGTVSAVQTNQNILASDNQVFQKGQASYPTYNAVLEARMPILNMENIFNQREAEAGTRKAAVEYIGTAQMYVRDLIAAYLDLAEANAIIAEYQEKIRLVGNRAETERQLDEASGGRPEVVASFEQQLSDLKAHLISDQGRRRDAVATLYELTGLDVGAVRGGVKIADLQLPANQLEDLRTLAGRNNVQYLAKQYEVDMFEENAKGALAADFGPRLNVFGTAEYEDRKGSQFGGGSTTVQNTLGIELKVPLFNGDGNGYKSIPASAERDRAVAELGVILRNVDSDLTRAYYNFEAARDRMAADRRTVQRGKDIIYLVNQRIESENAVSTEGLQSQMELAGFVRQRQQTTFEMLRAWLTIKYLLGALSEDDIAIFSGV